MRKSFKRFAVILLAVMTVLSLALLPACASCNPDDGNRVLPPPETGYSDKADLKYGEAMEGYKKTDFTGYWIWTQYSPEDTYVAARKTFTAETAQKATAYISAESKYFLWVNGVLTVYDGSTKRGPTPYDSYFDTVEIDVAAGENTLSFLIPYNGRSGDSSIDGAQALGEGDTQGGLLFEMKVGDKVVKSDSTWKVKQLTEYKNKRSLGAQYPAYEQPSMIAERNVYYDARERIDFTAKTFDDSAWDNATPIAKVGALPFGDMYASIIPLMHFDKTLTSFKEGVGSANASAAGYIGKTLDKNTKIEFVLPKNMQYSAYFKVTAPAGKKITYYSPHIPDGTQAFKDTYITADGTQSFESYPWRSGSNLVIEAEAGVKFEDIGYRASGYPVEREGAFESSDAELNKLWTMCANTVEICMRDTYMDCPDRERGPYMGDATNEMDIADYAFGTSSHALTKKMILSAVAWTGKDSLIPSRAPSNKPHEIPAQSLAFSTAAYNYFLHTGDKETANAYYTALIDYLKVWKMKDNGMPENRAGEWMWTDWGTGADVELLQVLWYYYSLQTAEKFASGLNKTSDKAFLNERMTSIANNFDKLYKKADGYRSGDRPDERAGALAVITGLAKKSDYPMVKKLIEEVKGASPYMERFVLDGLCVMGEYETALNRIKARYGAMINSGDTTVWEKFARNEGTVNHGWSGGPLLTMSKSFAGIAPSSVGWESFEIKPENLFDSMSVKTGTVKGEISVAYKKEAEQTTFTVKIPSGNCTLKIPVSFGSAVTGDGITVKEVKDGYSVIELTKAGTYTIKAA